MRDWFRSKYGPNNAVLVLAGDINAGRSPAAGQRYFGGIARGPVNTPAAAPVPTLPARVDRQMHDRVANTRLYRMWAVPGLTTPDQVPLQVGAAILGGLASSRLDNAFVRGDQSAVRVSTFVQPFQRVSHVRDPGRREAGPGRRRGLAPARRRDRRFRPHRPDRG